MTPAILTNGRIVTGFNHGDAFSKLTEIEKDNCLSGFVNNNEFVTDECFVTKTLIFVRHAPAQDEHITKEGKLQMIKLARNLLNIINQYNCLSSPITRCQESAKIIEKICKIHFTYMDLLIEKTNETIQEFNNRIIKLLKDLPQKTLVVSHSDLAESILNYNLIEQVVSNSYLYIKYWIKQ